MDTKGSRTALGSLALVGSFTPRQSGNAVFTSELAGALRDLGAERDCFAVAVNEARAQHAYSDQVRFQIGEADLASYAAAADYLNVNDVSVVSLQYDHRVFGGVAGANVLTLLRELRMPVVTTLHTVQSTPSLELRAVLDGVCSLSDRLVVMTESAAELVRNVHRVAPEKIDVIPHGVPLLPIGIHSKVKVRASGRFVLLSFGLLMPDKGIEHVIDALPAIVRAHPEVVYLVVGPTHPQVKQRYGEAYRLLLETRARRLGVEDHVVFHDRFVGNVELAQFLSAADVCVTPNLDIEQMVSGVLAYAIGSGKAVISTPYAYARELLGEGRGVLVAPNDSAAIADAVLGLVDDAPRRLEMARKAGALGRGMAWPIVARDYLQSFQHAATTRDVTKEASHPVTPPIRQLALPEINLAHLRALTDETGVLKHAIWSVPRYEGGYCIDDNARALQLLGMIEDARIETPAEVRVLANRYLAFLCHAFDHQDKRFRSALSYARQWTRDDGSEESHCRTLWALGTVIGRSQDAGGRALASSVFNAALGPVDAFTRPLALAYALLGLNEYLRGRDGDEILRALARSLAQRLTELFQASSRPSWQWLEDHLSSCGGRVVEALLRTGVRLGDEHMVATGLRSLDWLVKVQDVDRGMFAPVGSKASFVRDGEKPSFDQLPVDACSMVAACLQAYRVTGERAWLGRARLIFDWFLGRNELDSFLYDAATGGCRDALRQDGADENQGAEATLSFLMALVDLRNADRPIDVPTALFGKESLRGANQA
jgi:glycosyltransferase involved in cell wall biosynthesis